VKPTSFADYYDNVHIPLLKECVGDAFPTSHVRYYTKRISGAPEFTPLVLVGTPEDIRFDSITIMTFEDGANATRFQTRNAELEVYSRLEMDEAKYIADARLKVFAVESPHITKT
ncbi:hypothetical protein K458DRAFT_303860, partial [Lentithecium fluviatile CBS 122367]